MHIRIATAASLWNNENPMSEVVIEPAIFEDLDELSNLLGELFSEEKDFRPNKQKQLQGLRLIFEEPNRGRVFVLRRDRTIVAMINLLFTISTAEGRFRHSPGRFGGARLVSRARLRLATARVCDQLRQTEKVSAHHLVDGPSGAAFAEFL